MLDKLNIERKKLNSLISIFLIISVLGYLGRNITRLNKEIEVYNYPIFESPYFFVQHVESMVILDEGNLHLFY